jgi:hypothetical protein
MVVHLNEILSICLPIIYMVDYSWKENGGDREEEEEEEVVDQGHGGQMEQVLNGMVDKICFVVYMFSC